MVRHGIQTAIVMGQSRPHRSGRGRFKDHPGRLRHRTAHGARWDPIVAPAGAERITGDIKLALLGLLIVWTFAAFGEEIAYRGYLLTRMAEIGKGTRAAYGLGLSSPPSCLV